MRTDDMILISVDDHVVEPRDLFERHMPKGFEGRAPKVVTKRDGSDVWIFEGQQIPNIGLNAVVGRPPEEYGMEPTAFSQLRPACYDLDARIDDMNAGGMLASLCFPSFPGLCGQRFIKTQDKQLALACLRAYNDWHIDSWCADAPGRFIPLALLPMWDTQLMVEEIRRVARKGCTAVSFSEHPGKLDLPSLHSDHWDPFWKACVEEDVVVCIHIGSGNEMIFTSMDAPIDTMITLMPINTATCATDLLWSRVLRKFPELRIALNEGGIGWVPHFLERADYVYEHHRLWTHQDFGKSKPSEIFLDRMLMCFISDRTGVLNRAHLNIDQIAWECDYPHSDTTWPKAPEALARDLEGVPDDEVNKISHENAMRFFRFDAFAQRPRERCTVAALRAEAAHVDVTPRSQPGMRPIAKSDDVITCGEVMKQLTTAMRSPVS